MKIADIKKLDVGTQGFSVEAQVLRALPVRTISGQHGTFQRQNILLVDGDEKLFSSIATDFVTNQDTGKPIVMTGCKLSSYTDKDGVLQLSLEATGKECVITMARDAKTEPATLPSTTTPASTTTPKSKETVAPPKTFDMMITEVVDEVQVVFNNPAISEIVKLGAEKGFASEDVRAFIISRMIQKERKW